MQILIKSGIEGAKQAKGTAVIIDIIHASSTIVELFEAGAKKIVPVETLKEARKLRKKGEKICGEWLPFRKTLGRIDIINSPYYPNKSRPLGTVIMNTKNGTKGILNARGADQIMIASFLNAKAVADYIKKQKPTYVTLIPMGSRDHKSSEDEQFALYFSELLKGKNPDVQKYIEALLSTRKNKLRMKFFGKYSKKCFDANSSSVVPIVKNGWIVKA